jgi:hypothetical protein
VDWRWARRVRLRMRDPVPEALDGKWQRTRCVVFSRSSIVSKSWGGGRRQRCRSRTWVEVLPLLLPLLGGFEWLRRSWWRAMHGVRSEFLPTLASGLFLASLGAARRGSTPRLSSFLFSFLFLPSSSPRYYQSPNADPHLPAAHSRLRLLGDTEEGDVGPMLLGTCSSSSSHSTSGLGEGGGSAHEMRDEWGLCERCSLGLGRC